MRTSRFLPALVFSLLAPPRAGAAPAKAPRCASSHLTNEQRCAVANAKIRAVSPDLADKYKALYSKLMRLAPVSATTLDALPELSPAELSDLNRHRHDLAGAGASIAALGPFNADGGIPGATCSMPEGTPLYQEDYCVSGYIYQLASKNVPEHLTKIEADLDGLKNETQRLEDEVSAAKGLDAAAKRPFEERLAALGVSGQKVWEELRLDNVNEEDSVFTVDPKRQLNALQTDVADIAKRLKKIDLILHGDPGKRDPNADGKLSAAAKARLAPALQNSAPFGGGPAFPDMTSGGAAPVPTKTPSAPPLPAVSPPVPRAKSLLDLPSVPALTSDQTNAAGKSQPAVFAGAPGEDTAPEDTAAVNALRKAGKTATIGDVDRRAAYVFRQTGNTCAIGAQIQVLADLGQVSADPQKLKAKEDELYNRAVNLGYFTGSAEDPERRNHGGNVWEHLGDLLDRPINRLYQQSGGDLVQAVSTGHMVLVTVDSGALWNSTKDLGAGHAVAVTGVELNRETRQPVGYYINDTGMGEGGRFVAAKQFDDAWKEKTMVVPQ